MHRSPLHVSLVGRHGRRLVTAHVSEGDLAQPIGIGDDAGRRVHSSGLRITGKHHGAIAQHARVRQGQHRLRAARDDEGVVGRAQHHAGIGGVVVRLDLEDLDGGVTDPGPLVDDALAAFGPINDRTEEGHPSDTRAVVKGLVDPDRWRGLRPGRQIIAHDEVAHTHPLQVGRQTSTAPSALQPRLHCIKHSDVACAGQRDGIAHPPRIATECLQWFVLGAAPYELGEGGTGHDEGSPGFGLGVEPLRGVAPMVGQGHIAAPAHQLSGESGPPGSDQRQQQHT